MHKIKREEEKGAHNIKEVREMPKHIGIQTPLKSCLAEVCHFLFASPPEQVCETLL